MPKRLSVSLAAIASWDNLVDAVTKAAKGKHTRPDVQFFYKNLERSLAHVQRSILKAELVDGTYRSFIIRDPKPRVIHAASFPDRVIHHALINCIGARLEKSWVDSSYACRVGYGSHLSVLRAAQCCRTYNVVIKQDVRAYFPHIQHDVLIGLLQRQLKGEGLFWLIHSVLSSFTSTGTGLPIGALTSQYFANHYLDGYQRWLRCRADVQSELRYMDDVLVFCGSIENAHVIQEESALWLKENRQLLLKPSIAQYTQIGVPFCGYHVRSGGIRLSKRRKRSYQRQLSQLYSGIYAGEISSLDAQQRACQLRSLCHPGSHLKWLRSVEHKMRKYHQVLEV